MYPKFKEISLDTATWTVAFLGAIEERETKSKKPFCTFHLLDGAIAITANLWNTEKKDIYKVQEKSVISVQLYKKLYNGVETYEVKEYQAAPDDAKLEDYLLTAPIPSQDMMDEIKSILSKEISETELYPLVMEILDENADKLLYWTSNNGNNSSGSDKNSSNTGSNSSSSDNISSVTQIPDYKDGSTTTMPGVRDDLVDGGMNAFYTITDTYELFSRFSGSNAMNNYCTLAYIKDIHVDSIRKNVILKTNYKSNVRRWVVEKDGGSKVVVQTDDPKHQFDFSTMNPGEYTVTAYQKVTYTVGTSVKYDICEYLFDPVTNGLIYFNEQTVENGTNKSLSLDTVTKTGYVATGDVFRIHVNNLGKVETVSPSTNRTE